MSGNETPSSSTGTPPENETESSLDQLLDTVRTHLDEPPPGDDDIPLLTEVVVAANAAPESTPPVAEFSSPENAARENPNSISGVTATVDSGEPNDTTQLPQPNPPGVTDAEDAKSSILSASAVQPASDSADLITEENPTLTLGPDDSDFPDFADLGDFADFAEQPPADVHSTDLISIHTAESELPEPAKLPVDNTAESPSPDWGDADDTFDVTQVVSAYGDTDNTSEQPQIAQPQLPDQWLERIDHLIDDRCQSLATELKLLLREAMDLSAPDPDNLGNRGNRSDQSD